MRPSQLRVPRWLWGTILALSIPLAAWGCSPSDDEAAPTTPPTASASAGEQDVDGVAQANALPLGSAGLKASGWTQGESVSGAEVLAPLAYALTLEDQPTQDQLNRVRRDSLEPSEFGTVYDQPQGLRPWTHTSLPGVTVYTSGRGGEVLLVKVDVARAHDQSRAGYVYVQVETMDLFDDLMKKVEAAASAQAQGTPLNVREAYGFAIGWVGLSGLN